MNEDVPFNIVKALLRWSSDPRDKPPHSDYTIKIILEELISNEGGEDSTVLVGAGDRCGSSSTLKRKREDPPCAEYQVHKTKLFERCEYFNRQELGNECTIVLPQKAAEVFSMVLDSIYSSDDSQLALTPKTVAAIAYLAGYFGIPATSAQVTHYFEGNPLELGDCEMCYQDAKTFRNEKLEELVADKCAENAIAIMETKSQLLGICDFEFWKDVICRLKKYSMEQYKVPLVLELCSIHEEAMDEDSFKMFTSELSGGRLLLDISYEEAIRLFKFASKFAPTGANGRLTCVQRDCIKNLEVKCIPLSDETRNDMANMVAPHQVDFVHNRLVLRSQAVQAAKQYIAKSNGSLPERICVSGAGSAEANGWYSRATNFCPNNPLYCKQGKWQDDNSAKFNIWQTFLEGPDPITIWELFVVFEDKAWPSSEGGKIDYKVTDNLYQAFSFAGCHAGLGNGIENLPPTKSWTTEPEEELAEEPAPTLEYGA